jgi:hypothetical protein
MEYTLTNNSNVGDISAEQLYNYSEKTNPRLLRGFFEWCVQQEDSRFLWLAVTFFVQIGAVLPLTIFTILFLGNNSLLLWIISLAVNVPSLILNLGVAHTKFTLPVFFFSLLTETVIIAYCLVSFLMH